MADLEQTLARAGSAIDPGWDDAHTAAVLAVLHRRVRQRRTMMFSLPAALLVMGLAGGWLLRSVTRGAVGHGDPNRAGRTSQIASSGATPTTAGSAAGSNSPSASQGAPAGAVASAGGAPESTAGVEVAPAAGSIDPPGWSATPSDEKSSITLAAESPSEVLLALRGSGRFQADPRSGRTLRIQVVEMAVVLRSGRIELEQRGERVWLLVREGNARIEWDQQAAALKAGEEGWFPPAGPRAASAAGAVPARGGGAGPPVTASPPAVTVAQASAAPEPPADKAVAAVAPAAADNDWRTLAARGEFEAAFAALVAGGSGQTVQDDPEDLLLAADAARLSGHPEAALPYLDRVLNDHSQDPRAPVAAFTKGRVLLELARFGDAASAFTLARGLALDGALAEDALAREVEALSRAGLTARAHKAAAEYVRRYPTGAWLRSVRRYGGL